ncbi:MAG TPA: 6-pyruvoyl-tetrahydropterin synthase-related protein [Vicinamibacteria bacterium]|nr:6-pyruvoyl-tetrahydropterin synthase-related protein [Vicinamibacteria bacterium]
MAPAKGRQRLADALGLATILLVLLDLLRPSLLLLPTITAGGDTPCHYPTAVWFHERLLPSLRLHGWYPGASLGHPLLLYYFPFPFLLMSALAPLVGMPVAFKLGTALGVFLLPLLVYASFRLMRLAFPAPLLGAGAALVFLYVEDNPIWGGTIASTLTGEFSYTYGVGFAILFLGVLFRARADGRGPWAPAAVLALTSYAHGYAVLWAGLTATGLLLCDPATSRRPWRTLGWLLAVAVLAFALAGPALVPLLADWGWTTPFDDAWIDVTARGVFPELLRPLLLAGALAVAATLARRARGGRPDERLLLLGFGALSGAALASAGPGLGVIDVRFVPLAQLSLALAGAAGLGLALARLALADVAAVGLVLAAAVHADASSRFLRHWVDWNYSGLEAKELWPAWKELMGKLGAGPGAPRVAFEYGAVHERAGSIRMHETVPFFSGRSGIEGVYNQSSLTTHPVYYLLSELFPSSPNPFRSRTYSRFDLETALARLPLLGVDRLVAVSDTLASALDARADVRREARIPPYTLYRLTGTAPRYVEPLAFAPVRAAPAGWRDQAFRWFSRKPPNRAVLVFTADPRFDVVAADPWAPPPERPLPAGAEVTEAFEAESIRITTSRPGHPLLVKVSYHPRWRAEGADGPYLASPGFMLIVPRQREVRLAYAARTGSDYAGLALAVLAIGLAAASTRRGRRGGEDTGEPGGEPRPDGGRGAPLLSVLPLALVVGVAALRFVPEPSHAGVVDALDVRASQAYAQERWEDAAEYARHAAALLASPDPRRAEMLCVRGEALLRAGHAREAVEPFALVVEDEPGPHRPQALHSGALTREAAGDPEGASAWRRQLREEYPETPWARRLEPPADPSTP